MSKFTEMIRKLTDVFSKNIDSNVGKLILLFSEKIEEAENTFYKIESWRDINQAEGATLDLMGKDRSQQRGQVTDEIMRILIKARIARNSSDGTINSIIEALSLSLNASPYTIKIKALWNEGKPATLMIEDIPLTALNRAGMSITQFGAIAQEVTAAGVRITSVNLTGTFALSSKANELETSLEFGLAPLDQSTGGILGAAFDPNQNIELPL